MKRKKQIKGFNCLFCVKWAPDGLQLLWRSFWGRSEVGMGWIFLGIYRKTIYYMIVE